MSRRIELDSGVTWNEQRRKAPRGLESGDPWWDIYVRMTDAKGGFARELLAQRPEASGISVHLDSRRQRISLADLGEAKALRQLIIDETLRALPLPAQEALPERLEWLSMAYVEGLTERLNEGSSLSKLTLYQPPAELDHFLNLASGRTPSQSEFYRGKRSSFGAASGEGPQPTEWEFQAYGTLNLVPAEGRWPQTLSIINTAKVTGLVEASEAAPFNLLYLYGVRNPVEGRSFWEVVAESVSVDYAIKPPKWLVEAWPDRPAQWRDRFHLSPHPLLPGS